jgi:hypothetical protein
MKVRKNAIYCSIFNKNKRLNISRMGKRGYYPIGEVQ